MSIAKSSSGKPIPFFDTRIVHRFLFLPKILDGKKKWFQTARILQRLYPVNEWNDMGGQRCEWFDDEWV